MEFGSEGLREAKKEGSEVSSPKVWEAEEPCLSQAALGTTPLFMTLVDNAYQSAVTGFCLLTQQGYHNALGASCGTAGESGGPSQSFSASL